MERRGIGHRVPILGGRRLAEVVPLVGGTCLLNCKAGAPRTEHYQLVRALSADAVVTVL